MWNLVGFTELNFCGFWNRLQQWVITEPMTVAILRRFSTGRVVLYRYRFLGTCTGITVPYGPV